MNLLPKGVHKYQDVFVKSIIMGCNIFTLSCPLLDYELFLKDTYISHGSLAAKTNKP